MVKWESPFSKLASIACAVSCVVIHFGVSSTSIIAYPPLTMLVDQPPWVIPAIGISLAITLLLVILSVVTREANTWYKIGPICFLLGIGWLIYYLVGILRLQISL